MIAYPTALAARQRPPAGSRVVRPISGGLWLPSPYSGAIDAAGCNPPARILGGVTRVQGPFGGPALKLDNSTGYIDCGLNGNTTFNWSTSVIFPRTFWAWVLRPSSTSAGPVFSKGNNSPNTGWNFNVRSDGYLQSGTVGSSNGLMVTTGVSIPANTWTMVGVSWGGDVTSNDGISITRGITHYVDGRQMPWSSGTIKGGANQNANDTFSLWVGHAEYTGGSGGAVSAYADLVIDHWGFDHRYYSPEEMAELYARPFRNFAPSPIFGRILAGAAATASRPVVFACT